MLGWRRIRRWKTNFLKRKYISRNPAFVGTTSEAKSIFFFPCSHSPQTSPNRSSCLISGKMQLNKCIWSSYPHIIQTPSNKSMRLGWFPAPANQETWISLQTLSWMEPYRAHRALILTHAPTLCTNTHIHETEHHPHPTLPICSLPTSRLEFNSLWLEDWTDLWANSDFCPTPLNHCSLTGPSWSWLLCGHKNALQFSVLTGMGTPTALSHGHGPTGKTSIQRGLGTQQAHVYMGRNEPAVWRCSLHTLPTPAIPIADPAGANSHPSYLHTGSNTRSTQGKLTENKAVTAIPCLLPHQNKRVLLCHCIRGKDVNLGAPFTHSANQNTPEVI